MAHPAEKCSPARLIFLNRYDEHRGNSYTYFHKCCGTNESRAPDNAELARRGESTNRVRYKTELSRSSSAMRNRYTGAPDGKCIHCYFYILPWSFIARLVCISARTWFASAHGMSFRSHPIFSAERQTEFKS